MLRYVLVLWVFMVALPLHAQDVDRNNSCDGASGVCIVQDQTAATADSLIKLNAGNLYTLIFDPDIGGTGVATAEMQLYGPCSYTTITTDVCEKLLVDTDGDGSLDDVTLTGDIVAGQQRGRIYDIPGGLYLVDFTTGPGAGEVAHVSFTRN